MKLGGEIKTRRLSVLDEYKFVNARARSLPAWERKQNARWEAHRAFCSGDVLL